MKKIFTFFFVLIASVGTIFAESGTCGDNLTWDLTDGVLTISGTGEMKNWNYSYELYAPWYENRERIVTITIGDGVTTIGNWAFSRCSNLTSVAIPNSVTSIGGRAFADCSGLRSIVIPNNVTSIGILAFFRCTSLTSLIIPNSVASVGQQAFQDCSGLTSVTCEAANPPTCGEYAFYNVNKTIPLYVPVNSVDGYKKANGWKDFANIQAIGSNTAIDQVSNDQSQMTNKIIKDNQLLILRGDHTYTFTGQEIK